MQFTGVVEIYIKPTPVAMATKIWEFQHKNGQNQANMSDRAKNIAPNRGFSRLRNLLVSFKFTLDRPLLPWQRKFGNFSTKLARTQIIQEIEPMTLHQTGVMKVRQFNKVTEVYSQPTRVAMVTKYENFNTKFTLTHLIFYGQTI